jgi:nucleotide-binding universal stress UspA family protein
MQGKHRDYEPFEMGENMEEDLGMFEAAMTATRVDLDFSPIASVLMILDGGILEATCRAIGSEVAKRLSATSREMTMPRSAQEIVRTCNESKMGLMVLPVPGGEDSGQLSCQSLGTLAASLLQTCETPILCVRGPLVESAIPSFFDKILTALMRDDHCSAGSIAWAFRLASPRTRIHILELADRSSLLEARRLLQGKDESASIEEATINRAVTSRLGGLIGAAQQHAHTKGVHTHVEFRLGNPVKETLSMADSFHAGLIIVSRPKDHTSTGFHFVQDVLLATRKCVLVV